MKKLADIMAGANATAEIQRLAWESELAKNRDEFSRPRPYKVTLCVTIFSEIVVEADNPNAAGALAQQSAERAAVVLQSVPYAHRWQVQKRSKPSDPLSPLEWVEVEHGPVDRSDLNSPPCWHLKK